MNSRLPFAAILILLTSAAHALAQGDLNPPGPPSPTMQTLDQIGAKTERRTPISSLPFTVNAPGSYYLTGNLTGTAGQNGIVIAASNVTLDLNGFTLAGPGDNGIQLQNAVNSIAIRNGSIHGWNNCGILGATSSSVLVENLKVSQNASIGIKVGSDSIVQSCTLRGNGADLAGTGISVEGNSVISKCVVTGTTGSGGSAIEAADGAVVIDCTARANGGTSSSILRVGQGAIIMRCSVTENDGASVGVQTGAKCKVIDCVVADNGNANNDGIEVGAHSEVRNCTVTENGGDGIRVRASSPGCLIIGNTVSLNGENGVNISSGSGDGRIEANHIRENVQNGLRVNTTDTLIIKNSFAGNTTEANVNAGNAFGPVIGRSAIANGSNTNPHANFDLDTP